MNEYMDKISERMENKLDMKISSLYKCITTFCLI